MSLTKATYAMVNGAQVNVLDFGADPSGVSDSSAAFQAALDSATQSIYIPPGAYKIITPLTYTGPAFAQDDGAQNISIYGAGESNTTVYFDGAAGVNCLTITGNTAGAGAGVHTYVKLQGLRFQRKSTDPNVLTGVGVKFESSVYIDIQDVLFERFNTGLWLADCVSLSVSRCAFWKNNIGLLAERTAGINLNNPNAITLNNCYFRENYISAVQAKKSVCFNIFGGSAEFNGDATEKTIYFEDGPDGAVGLNINGMYFEGNKGNSDVYALISGDNDTTVSIQNCTFNKISSTSYTDINVNVDGLGAGGKTKRVAVSLIGNGFFVGGTYTPNAARRSVQVASAVSYEPYIFIFDSGNNYVSALEEPTYNLNYQYIRFNPNGAVVINDKFYIDAAGNKFFYLPTSSSGLPSGAAWNDGGTVKVIP